MFCGSTKHGKITKAAYSSNNWKTTLRNTYQEIKFGSESDVGNNAGDVVKIDLNQPMADILKTLSKCPVPRVFSLSGSCRVAILPAKLQSD